MKRNLFITSGLYLLSLGLGFLPVSAQALAGLADFGIQFGSQVTPQDLSADGSVVIGWYQNNNLGTQLAFKWTGPTGAQDLNPNLIPGGGFTQGFGTNSDGSVIVGLGDDGTGNQVAFRWTQSGGYQNLGDLNGGIYAAAFKVSADGNTIVGEGYDGSVPGNFLRAFIWTSANPTLVSLGTLPGQPVSSAAGISDDGTIITGYSGVNNTNCHAFRYSTTTATMQDLLTLNGGTFSNGMGISGNGTVIVGQAEDGITGFPTAFRWTQQSGMQSLGILSGGNSSSAMDANIDGSVIVGNSDVGGGVTRGFRWTAAGMQKIEDWLRSHGVYVPTDITSGAAAVNATGNVVVGTLASGDGYIARVDATPPVPPVPPVPPAPTPMRGLIALSNLSQSLFSVTEAPLMIINNFDMLVHGGHGYPLTGLIPLDRDFNVWAAGDWGKFTHDAEGGLVEVGISQRLSDWFQYSLGVGATRAHANLRLNGHARSEGTYGLVEGTANYDCFYATLTGFYQGGELKIRRAYTNAGAPDSSYAEPETETFAFRFRIDWKNMLEWARFSLSPYGEVSNLRARINSYAENGGGFPARFNGSTTRSTDGRVGVRAYLVAGPTTKFFATGEGVFNLGQKIPRVSGQLIGLFTFNTVSPKLPRRWLRGGLGLEQKICEGLATLAVNGTTKGQDPRYWIAASYYLTF